MITSKTVYSFQLSQQEGHTLLTAHHDTDRTFCIIHLSSGDHDGQHPEQHITITQDNYMQFINDLKDTMAQAAVWYKTNVIDTLL